MLETLLHVAGGWVLAALALCVLVYPWLRVAACADAAQERVARVWAERAVPSGERDGAARRPVRRRPTLEEVPSPQRLGYSSVVLDRLVHHACTVLAMERACVLARLPDDTDQVAAVASAGFPADLVGRRYPAKSGLAGLTIRSGRPVLISDVRSRPCPPAPFDEDDVDLAAAAPLAGRFGPAGALAVGSSVDRPTFGLGELELLCELAGLVSDAVRRYAQRGRGPSDSQAEVQGLVKALGDASGGTWGHSLEVADLATRVGKRLALEPCDLVELELAGLLHDVGKLRLPPRILTQRAPLSDADWRLVRLHPEWGAEMASRIPGLEAVALIIRLHHERPDGTGYPHGLSAARIPIASRIVSVCDAFSAMTTDRPYRAALDLEAARAELREGAGSQFDPAVVEALGAVVGLTAKAAA